MLKFLADRNGRKLLGLGISQGNVDKLKEGKPILVEGEKLGLPFDVFLFYGETEATMVQSLRDAGVELPPTIDWRRD